MNVYTKIIQIMFVIFITVCSYFLSSSYVNSDQKAYRLLYTAFKDTDFSQIILVAYTFIGSGEPLSVAILWLGAQLGIEKDLYITLWNFLFLFGLWLFCWRVKSGSLVLFLILTNFYILVLLTGAERLKFAFILITYGFIFFEKKLFGKLLFILSIGAHFQSILFLIGLGGYSTLAKKIIFSLQIQKNKLFIIIISILFMSTVGYYSFSIIIRKLDVYFGRGDIYDLVKPFLLFIVSVFSLKSIASGIRIFICMVPLFYILGDNRMSIVYFSLLFFLLGLEGRLKSPAFLITMIYFSYASIGLVFRIFTLGHM